MNATMFGRLTAALVCVAAVATAWDAEAAPRHRRRCCDPCCQPVCYQPACTSSCCSTSCCETAWTPSCCGTSYVSYSDACGRIVWRRAACYETVASTTIVVPAAACCAATGDATANAATIAETAPARTGDAARALAAR